MSQAEVFHERYKVVLTGFFEEKESPPRNRVSQHARGQGSVAHQASLGGGACPSHSAMTGGGVRASRPGNLRRVAH